MGRVLTKDEVQSTDTFESQPKGHELFLGRPYPVLQPTDVFKLMCYL